MLRSYPSLPDGRVVDLLVESTRVNRPFKAPSLARRDTDKPQRKRKRVSYKENNPDAGDDDDSDDGGGKKKRRKSMGDEFTSVDNTPLLKYPVFKPKSFEEVYGGEKKLFLIPSMTTKDGRVVRHAISNASLGLKVQPVIPPKPLHDPMAEHAIVLYDPTIDDRETEEERQERLKEEAREAAFAKAAEGCKGMFNPHKSLRTLLGEDKKDKDMKMMKARKVPVVIDPVLSKVLRPHQIEGVKVCVSVIWREETYDALVFISVYDGDDVRESIWVSAHIPLLKLVVG